MWVQPSYCWVRFHKEAAKGRGHARIWCTSAVSLLAWKHWGFFGVSFYTLVDFRLAISMSQQIGHPFFQCLKLICGSLAALFFISSDICAGISSFDTCVCIWGSEMSEKHKETSLSAKTIAEPSSAIKKGLSHHRILYHNNYLCLLVSLSLTMELNHLEVVYYWRKIAHFPMHVYNFL